MQHNQPMDLTEWTYLWLKPEFRSDGRTTNNDTPTANNEVKATQRCQ